MFDLTREEKQNSLLERSRVSLIRPSEQYKDSYISAIEEFQQENRYIQVNIEKLSGNFGGFINTLLSKGDTKKINPYIILYFKRCFYVVVNSLLDVIM